MRRHVAVVVAALVIAGLAAPALSAETSDQPASVESRHSGDKDKDRDRQEKIRLEREARREADRRKWEEDNEGVTTADIIGAVMTVGADQGGMKQRFALGVVYAPANATKMSGIGIQWLNRNNRWGASVWLSGALDRGYDVIDAAIPHDDYYLQNQRGSYGLEGLYAVGSEKASLILGAGFAVEQTMYTAVSNVTGWRWNEGSDSRLKFAGQIGCRLRLAGRVSLSMGYDTHQSAFFGLAGDF
jgi:hypothetical protein